MDEPVRQESDVDDAMSIIGGGITVTGNIEASVDLHLLGKVNGDVRCATLILGENSVIRGSVYAERVRASGTIEGSVETKDLAVEASARLIGDVTYARIRIANGGIVDGRMTHRAAEEENEGSKLRLVEPATPPRKRGQAEAIHIE
jgi:cytoskeletal protein CcmA (bactofilin family)